MSFDPSFQGTKNYIADRDGTKLGKWVTYADAAQTNPVDGTGGSPASTFAVSTDSTMRGVTNFLWTHSAANRQGEGFSYDFSIDPSDKGKVLQCSFEYLISSGTYTDNDMSVWVYDVTNAALVQPSPYLIKNSGIIEKFAIEFQTASNSTSYRLIFHVDTATSTAYTIRFTSFNLGPQAKLYGSAVTDDIAVTITGSWIANTTYSCTVHREGDRAFFEGMVILSGAPTATGLTITLPSGFVIDVAKVPGGVGNGRTLYGITKVYDSSAGTYPGQGQVRGNSSTIVNLDYWNGTAQGAITESAPMVFATGDSVFFKFDVPIVGWSSSQVFSSDADVRVVAALIGGGTASYSANSPIIYSTVGLDTHGAYSTVSGQYTVKVPGFYNVNASGDGTSAAGSFFYISVNGNTTAGYNRPVIAIQEVVNQGFSGSGKVYALAGQTIDVRSTNLGGSISSFGTLQIERISGPSQIAASESVSALYRGIPTGTLTSSYNTSTFPTRVKDSHNAYLGGIYTVPTSGVYSISAQFLINGTYALNNLGGIAIFIDGVQSYDFSIAAGGVVSYLQCPISINSIPLLTGQQITIRSYSSATTPTFNSTGTSHFFSINRTGQY